MFIKLVKDVFSMSSLISDMVDPPKEVFVFAVVRLESPHRDG